MGANVRQDRSKAESVLAVAVVAMIIANLGFVIAAVVRFFA